ncbi:MAG TPA: DUF4252 domain-containing protein [Steroidobacteraceae bacterium]|jgi:hypothetical protein|nr:DUF4252 domain-containing protein [Steroidobacteraceae bacterium]
MKMRMVKIAMACLLLPGLGLAQDANLKLPEFKSLAGKATESVNISLSPWLLHMAGSFIDDKDADSVATKRILAGIKSIQVRSFQFASDNAYSTADIDGVRSQLAGPGWSQIMQVHHREKSEDVDMYVLIENNVTKGFALIASEPREFTIINIVGTLKVEDLQKLESHLHLHGVSDTQVNLLM